MTDTRTLLNREAAAAFLGIGLRSLERLYSAGVLAHVRPTPRRVMFRLADLEAFAERNVFPRPEWAQARKAS